jgi:hypothetical protein
MFTPLLEILRCRTAPCVLAPRHCESPNLYKVPRRSKALVSSLGRSELRDFRSLMFFEITVTISVQKTVSGVRKFPWE